ncbi:MAG: hypothetical protein ACR2NZ_11420 [Rubripirellula sp.]
MKSMIVIARNYGQLGNRLFLYAHFIAAAQEYGVSVVNPCFSEYADLFPATAGDLWCRYPLRESVSAAQPAALRRKALSKSVYLSAKTMSTLGLKEFPFRIIRLRGDETCDLGSDEFSAAAGGKRPVLASGWLFRSERLLKKHAASVRTHFRVAETHRQSIDRLMGRLRRESDLVVGVHIRHGDYATFMNGRYFYSLKEYSDAMRNIADQFPGKRVSFLVCGNAKFAADDFDGLSVTPGPGHIIEDMYALAETDLMFGPPSTYTGWAAFYGDTPLSVMETANEEIDVTALRHEPIASVA